MHIKVRRKHEGGQAIAELAAGLVALMAVFLGLLFVSALGIENIETLLEARGNADENAATGLVSSDSGVPIREWSLGADQLQFTSDDEPAVGGGGNAAVFLSELADDDGRLNLTSDLVSCSYIPTSDNFAMSLPTSNIFIGAANLTSDNATESDPIGARGLGDLAGAFRSLIMNTDFTLSETVYMPVLSSE